MLAQSIIFTTEPRARIRCESDGRNGRAVTALGKGKVGDVGGATHVFYFRAFDELLLIDVLVRNPLDE